MGLFIDKTPHTPLMKFENGVLLISGRSIPEDSMSLYEPLLKYITEYTYNPLPHTEANIYLEYSNSSTNRSLMLVFELFQKLYSLGNDVSINWYYMKGDDEMIALGEDLKSLWKIPFEIKEVDSF